MKTVILILFGIAMLVLYIASIKGGAESDEYHNHWDEMDRITNLRNQADLEDWYYHHKKSDDM